MKEGGKIKMEAKNDFSKGLCGSVLYHSAAFDFDLSYYFIF